MLIEVNNRTRSKVDELKIKKIIEKFVFVYKIRKQEISIAFIGDKRMRDLNKLYRRKDRVTDILTFDGDGDFFGEIIIDLAQIKRQAKIYSCNSFKKELYFILVHGLLHLVGYNDDTEKKRLNMIMLGEKFIEKNKF